MDFKVAGDGEGVTAFQLDIKCEGLSIPLMRRAGIAVLDPGPVTKANAATPDLLHHNNIFGPAIFLPLMQSMARLCP